MKVFLIIVFLIVPGTATFAQIPDGTYSMSDENLTFSGDSVTYHLNTHSCLVSDYKGKAIYTINKKRLIIKPAIPAVLKFIKAVMDGKSADTLYLDVADYRSKNPLVGASVTVMRDHHMVMGYITPLNGRVAILRSKLLNADSIKISMIGFYNAVFKPQDAGADYKIVIKSGANVEGHQAYVSNKNKGYEYRLTKTGLEVNFEKTEGCGKKDNWIIFKKE